MRTLAEKIIYILHGYSSLQVIFAGPKGDTATDARIILFDDSMVNLIKDDIETCLNKQEDVNLIMDTIMEDGNLSWEDEADLESTAEKIYNALKGRI